MNDMKNAKRKNTGFTLVELIVVLVILAILAAILVPALLGHVDRAKEQQIILNAKSCLTAAQAEFSEMYGKNTTFNTEANGTGGYFALAGEPAAERIMNTADVPDCTYLEVGSTANMREGVRAGYKITYVYYQEGDKSVYFDGKTWNTTDKDYNEIRNLVNPKVVYYVYLGYDF
jgi:prepilin-type N-terminal cleavage/methylation domain-containing protein